MYTNEEMEIRLWDYIDGNSDGAEKMEVQQLVATEPAWRERYDQLRQLHEELLQNLEPEQPSLRFTRNVMEHIAASSIARPARAYVNKWVVRSIGGFFIITLAIVLVTAVSAISPNMDFSDSNPILPAFMKHFSFNRFFNNGTVIFSVTASAIAALAFLDTYRTRMIRLKHDRHG